MNPDPNSQSADIKVIMAQMEGVQNTLDEIKTTLKCMNDWRSSFELLYTGEHVKLEESTKAAHRRLDLLEPKVDELAKTLLSSTQAIEHALGPLKTQAKIIAWVGGILGTSIILLIWAIIIGQVQLVFP